MSKIKVMDEQLSNRIAAGEVIERPASVVKELVENAIDAGATHIRIEIERAGSRLISVSDNGSGMDADDALLCIEPHGTSKIFTAEDIDRITTLGFRGEALPSIASISRFTILTRTAEMLEGTRVRIEGGRLLEAAPAGCAAGTVMQVRDLFFNTPARKKFLKSPATEAHHIEETVLGLALPRPEVGFELRIDGRTAFRSPAAPTPEARLRELFGRPFVENLWPVNHTESGITITGFTAAPGFTRNSRREQRTFVNGRAVESAAIYRGIRDGYATLTESGRYAPAVLFLTLAPEEVDVNVHPAKREVRFRNEFEVAAAVREAVAEAMSRAARTDNPFLNPETPSEAPSYPDASGTRANAFDPADFIWRQASLPPVEPAGTVSEGREGERLFRKTADISPAPLPSTPRIERILLGAKVDYVPVGSLPDRDAVPDLFQPVESDPEPVGQEEKIRMSGFPERNSLHVLGFLENSYIIATMKDSLVLIDQHAAHERVLYERLLKKNGEILSQKLLIPISLELSRSDCRFLDANREIFHSLGFETETFGDHAVKLNAIPQALRQDNAGGVFRDLLALVTENGTFSGRTDSAKLAQAACKAAVKAHDKLTMEECNALLDQMAQCDLPYCCPHGRPTILNISLNELERRFGRK